MMVEQNDDYQSLSRGVFVIPFNPDNAEAGPSKPSRPLQEVYDSVFQQYKAAHETYEADRTAEQLDDISDWLEQCQAPPLLKWTFPNKRLPIAIIQNISSTLPPLLKDISKYKSTVNGRNMGDLTSAVRAVAVGFLGEAVIESKRSGRTGMDEVERWWEGQKNRSPLLLHIDQGQLVPGNVLAELIYIITLHDELPLRLLISVPSTSTFLSSWIHIEPSSIHLTILHSGRDRKALGGVHAILKTASDPNISPLTINQDLADDLRREEELFGAGPASTLKALRWSLLHHEMNSPLSQLADDNEYLPAIQAILEATRRGQDLPGRELLEVSVPPSASRAALDPSPRISILHALSTSKDYTSRVPPIAEVPSSTAQITSNGETQNLSTTPRRKRKRRADSEELETSSIQKENHSGLNGHLNDTAQSRPAKLVTGTIPLKDRKGDLGELEILFNLWKSAGKNVNLWDWLEAYRITVTEGELHHQKNQQKDELGTKNGENGIAPNGSSDAIEIDNGDAGEVDDHDGKEREEEEQLDEETSARLHATFVRFCEEARMLGLVRARGRAVGRRGDEVVKGIGML